MKLNDFENMLCKALDIEIEEVKPRSLIRYPKVERKEIILKMIKPDNRKRRVIVY